MGVDYYDLLQVAPDADLDAIAAAYKRLVFEHHPDRNNSPEATATTAAINRAYDTLRDPASRAKYDSLRRSRQSSAKPDIPWIVLGMSKLALYDVWKSKLKHRQVVWEEGIWSEVSHQFASCKKRGCLVLIQIDPRLRRQTYKHGDPGPVLTIDPDRGEFSLIPPWIEACHEEEDSSHRP
jgi:DnaJ domain